MFLPNLDCLIYNYTQLDVYGQPLDVPPSKGRCAVVDMTQADKRTPVRSDTSASRGSARELVTHARLLFPGNTPLNVDDKVIVIGRTLKVMSVFPMYNVHGQLDHLQVDLFTWE